MSTAPQTTRAPAAPGATEHSPPDTALIRVRRTLVEAVGPQLGLSGRDVVLHPEEAGRRALAFGARGLTEGSSVFVAPGLGVDATREVLVHELVHVAQQFGAAAAAPGGRATPFPATDAEREARQLVRAWRSGSPLWVPTVGLEPGSIAAEHGGVRTPVRRHGATPAGLSDAARDEVDVGLREAELGQIVSRRWQHERARMIDRLDGLWIDAGDVRDCLRILDTMPFLVARALARSLPEQRRFDLASNITQEHHRLFPAAAVAALSALVPMELRRIETSAVQGLDNRGFDAVQDRSVARILQGLRQAVLLDLLRGERREFFGGLLRGPSGVDTVTLDRILALLRTDQGTEQRLQDDRQLRSTVRELTALLRDPGSDAAVTALGRLAALAPSATVSAGTTTTGGPAAGPTTSPAPGGGDATDTTTAGASPAARTAAEPPDPGERLRHVVTQLDAAGAIARLLDTLPDADRTSAGPHADQVLLVLAAREPSLNLEAVESLLSYGIFDWAVRDHEARYAYVLVRSLSLDAQDRWKRLEEGTWFQRLEDNIPAADVLSGRYRGVGRGSGAFSQRRHEPLDDQAMTVVREINRTVNAGLDPPTAVVLMRRLLNLGRHGAGTRRGATDRTALLSTAVRRLDTLGHIDRLLDALPDAYLLNEMWRAEVLEVLAARDPRHLERQARSLLSYGIFDWAVTAREAWLAYQLVRSLPTADQQRLQAEDPDRWARIQSEMTPEARASAGVNAIGARAGLDIRDRIRDRLRDRRLWTARRAIELRSMIIQLYALDDRRWVFLRSREVRADTITGLEGVVRDLRLYDSAQRPDFVPEQLRAPSALEDVFGAIGRYIVHTPEILGLLHSVLGALLSPEMRLRDQDLQLIQDLLGGDIMGARLQSREAVAERDRRETRSDRPDPNRLSIWIRPAEGRLGIDLPRLELAGLMHTGAGRSVRTGPVVLTGLHIVADFSDRGYTRPAGAILDASAVDITDAVLATASALVAATRVGVRPLHLRTGQTGTEDLTVPPPPNTIPIPVIGPLLNALSHILALTGSVPGVGSIGGLLVSPATSGTGFLTEQFTSTVANQVVTPFAEGLIGLVTDGAFRPPRTATERARDAAAMLRSFSLSLGDLTVEGLSLGGQQQVDSIRLQDVFLGLGFSRPAQLRHRIESLRRRGAAASGPERAALQREQRQLQAQLNALTDIEASLDRLESRHRWDADSLTAAERARLVELSAQLRQSTGGVADIGGISVRGLSGRVEAAGLDVGAIHAEGSAPLRRGEYLPDEERIARFRRERTTPSLADQARQLRFRASVGPIRLLAGPAGAPALRVRARRLPTAAEVEARIAAAPAGRHRDELQPWPQVLRDLERLEALPAEPWFDMAQLDADIAALAPGDQRSALQRWRAWVQQYRAGRATVADAPRREGGALYGQPRTTAEEQLRADLRTRAERYFGLTIDEIAIGTIRAGGTPSTIGVELGVGDVTATGIRTGTTRVGSVGARDVHIGVGLFGGAGRPASDMAAAARELGFPGLRPSAEFRAGEVSATGVDTPTTTLGGVRIRGIHGRDRTGGGGGHRTTLRVRVVPEGDDYRIPDLVIDSAELTGLSYRSAVRTVFATGTTRTGRIDADVTIRTARVGGATAAAPRLHRSAAAASSEVQDVAPRRVSEIVVNHLRIARVDADQVGLDVSSPAPGYRVEATSGALMGLWIRNLRYTMTDPSAVITGSLGVEQLERLQFSVVNRALRGAPTTITGRLGSGAPAGATEADRETASAVTVEMIESGDRQVDLRGVRLSEGVVSTPDGRIRVRRASLAGRVTQMAAGGLRFDHLGPLRVEVAAVDWRTAGGARLRARGSTVLDGIVVEGLWESEADTVDDNDRVVTGRRSLRLDTLRIARVTSDDFHYRDGTIDLRLGRFDRPPTPGMPPLQVRDVRVTGLRWDNIEGATSGRVDVGRTALDIAGRVSAGLHIRGSLAASSIGLNLHRAGRVVARVVGGQGDIGIGTTAAAADHHLSFVGLDTGVIDYRRDSIEIGPEGTEGLHLPVLTLDELNWHTSGGFGLEIAPGAGAITLLGTRARVRIELNPPGHPRGRLRRLLLRELAVPQARASGLRVALGSTASIALDATDEAVVRGIRLRPAAGEDGFVIEPRQTGPGLVTRGAIDVGAFQLPWVAADVQGLLAGNADVAADGLTVEFLGVPGVSHGLDVSLRNPSITSIHASLGPRFGEVFALRPTSVPGRQEWGLRASLVRYEQREAAAPGGARQGVEVRGANLRGLFYVNPRYGIRVFINAADVDGVITHDMLTGRGEIPRLNITNAGFAIDLATLIRAVSPPSSSGGSAVTGASIEQAWDGLVRALRPRRRVLEHIEGRANFDVHAGTLALPIRLTFRDGGLDYNRLAAGINAGRLPYHVDQVVSIAFVVRGDDLELWIRTPKVPIPVPGGGTVTLPDIRAMRWHPASGEVSSIRDDRVLPLWRALHPDSGDRTWVATQLASALSGPSGSLSIRGIDADLSVANPNEIRLPLGGVNEIVLAPNALAHLRASGSLGGRSASGASRPGRIDPISLDRATVARLHLVFGGTTVDTGRLEIRDLTDTRLTFSGLAPQLLTGRIRSATAERIRWHRPAGRAATPAPTAPIPTTQPTVGGGTPGSRRRPSGGAP